jgi:hypothetical protein
MSDTQLSSVTHVCAVALVVPLIAIALYGLLVSILSIALPVLKIVFGLYDELEHAIRVLAKVIVLLAAIAAIICAIIFAPLVTIATVAVLMLTLQLKRVLA